MRRWTELIARLDWPLFFSAMLLTSVGLLAIYGISVARGAEELFQFQKQLTAASLGCIAAMGIAFVDYRHIRTLALPIYLAGFGGMLLSLLFGKSLYGGGRWFQLGPLSFQPIEIAKVCLIIFLAQYLGRYARKRLDWLTFSGSAVALLGYLILALLQPDFGSGMVLLVSWGVMVLLAGLPKHAWWMILATVAVVVPLIWSFGLAEYQKDRLRAFIDPSADLKRTGYNVQQARIAIGSGGFFGKGIGAGSQARLRFLPVATSDFMFAVLGEELGFLGLAGVMVAFGVLLGRILQIGQTVPDSFAGLLAVGIVSVIGFHVLVNAGMNVGLMPVTGIPLPFVSAAASSVVTMFILVGLAESLAVQRRLADG